MLPFFRRIRKSLFNSGKMRRYFLYAFGEILLVMVGILLALQVNNWNETKKLQKKEKEILKVLKESTEFNKEVLENNHERVNRFLSFSDTVVALMEERQELTEEVEKIFGATLVTGFRLSNRINMAGFDAFENSGIDILQSTALSSTIVDLYGSYFPFMEARGVEWSSYLQDIGIELMKLGIVNYDVGGNYIPGRIYEEGAYDFLRSVIALRRAHKERALNFLEIGIDKCNTTLDLINSEINQEQSF